MNNYALLGGTFGLNSLVDDVIAPLLDDPPLVPDHRYESCILVVSQCVDALSRKLRNFMKVRLCLVLACSSARAEYDHM